MRHLAIYSASPIYLFIFEGKNIHSEININSFCPHRHQLYFTGQTETISQMALRWGIVSAGLISHDFVNAVSTLLKTEHQVLAVAARKLSSAKDFANLHGIPRAYEGYEALAKDPEIGKYAVVNSTSTTYLKPGNIPQRPSTLDPRIRNT